MADLSSATELSSLGEAVPSGGYLDPLLGSQLVKKRKIVGPYKGPPSTTLANQVPPPPENPSRRRRRAARPCPQPDPAVADAVP